jgi:hypothetical protein
MELFQRYSNDDMFLLALSGQVPVDKLLIRLQNFKKMEIKGQVELGESNDEAEDVRNPLDMLISDVSDDSEIYSQSSEEQQHQYVDEKSGLLSESIVKTQLRSKADLDESSIAKMPHSSSANES